MLERHRRWRGRDGTTCRMTARRHAPLPTSSRVSVEWGLRPRKEGKSGLSKSPHKKGPGDGEKRRKTEMGGLGDLGYMAESDPPPPLPLGLPPIHHVCLPAISGATVGYTTHLHQRPRGAMQAGRIARREGTGILHWQSYGEREGRYMALPPSPESLLLMPHRRLAAALAP